VEPLTFGVTIERLPAVDQPTPLPATRLLAEVSDDEAGSTLWFAATVFTSAALLFLIEPMIAKMALPQLGGTAAVWNTCMVFFQSALLAGYAFAHRLAARQSVRSQAIIQCLFLLSALVVLPVDLARLDAFKSMLTGVPINSAQPVGPPQAAMENPIPWLLLRLLFAVGLPFAMLSTMGPLMQKWFASTHSVRDPYSLYAAGNLGSMLALIAYPSLVEPFFSLGQQSLLWSCGYFLLVLLALICAVETLRARRQSRRHEGRRAPTASAAAAMLDAEPIPLRRRLRWIALALVPSSLMLGVTTYLSTDIATIPLLWIIPLALYLLSFILVFAKKQVVPHAWMSRLLPALTLLLVILLSLQDLQPPIWVTILLHLLTFFVAAMYCHGELAADRPPPDHLTEFYLCLGVGGMLGGVFNALLAPLIFSRVIEYPLGLVLVCLLRYRPDTADRNPRSRLFDWIAPLGLGLLTAALVLALQRIGLEPIQLRAELMFGLPAALCYTLVDRPLRFALGIGAIIVASLFYVGVEGRTIYSGRSFFGVVRVTVDTAGRFHQLVHGNTIHGRQSIDPSHRHEPLTYYHRTGPVGSMFEAFKTKLAGANIGVIGLGAGSLACYAQPEQRWTFYEIDPLVERIARDPKFFTFLKDCSARKLEVVLGDGRLRLQEASDAQYQLIVLDAFSSDALPVHLLTREALRIYLSKLAKGGVLAFHISNRYLDLQPVLTALARDGGLTCRFCDDLNLLFPEREVGKEPSQWAVISRALEDLGSLVRSSNWQTSRRTHQEEVWTDHFSNILGIFIWQ
jgi:hypothetical protein